MAKNLSVALRILANSDQANAELQKVQASLDRMRGALARVGHYGALAFSGWNIVGGIGELAKLADSVKLVDATAQTSCAIQGGSFEAFPAPAEMNLRSK